MILGNFWSSLDNFLQEREIVTNRPKNTPHPKHKGLRYPVDYGYVKDTVGADSDELDLFVGKLTNNKVSGVLLAVDLKKKSCEIKILYNCSEKERDAAQAFFNRIFDKKRVTSCILIDRITITKPFDSPFGEFYSQHKESEFLPEIVPEFLMINKIRKNQRFWTCFWESIDKLVDISRNSENKTPDNDINSILSSQSKNLKGTGIFFGQNKTRRGLICTIDPVEGKGKNIIILNCSDEEICKILKHLTEKKIISLIIL
ncbi:MAG: hypothetical protein LBH37_03520 [Oscillospiraceae bacterium]|nr:hypothetical protein [Oscillospiraceae bacterium]